MLHFQMSQISLGLENCTFLDDLERVMIEGAASILIFLIVIAGIVSNVLNRSFATAASYHATLGLNVDPALRATFTPLV